MTKFIILIGRKYFVNYVAQNNYWLIIQIKLLTAPFLKKNNIKTKDCNKIVKTQKWFR